MVSESTLSNTNLSNVSGGTDFPPQLLEFLTELARALTSAGIAVMTIESIIKNMRGLWC
ncbi:hypothetical protein [Methanobacterium ferruginis]|uniref:hypothetical protein n=1 Tax=Methanobacterium ferruginis TaxID=710191 RepID=UPI0025747DC2|nr:hypothetical protein [Methanobacterium ferruginis]BDZ67229.1 hypothetical protein GCM10025860_06770 [Methanobacterium ferruginis]